MTIPTKCYAAKTPVHTETCPECGGRGFLWSGPIATTTAPDERCMCCRGSGRVPVPMRDCTRDDRDLEADELRGKLKFATRALQVIAIALGCEHDDGREGEYWSARRWLKERDIYDGDLNGHSVLIAVAREALNQLSKSASNPQENHGT